MAADLIDFGRRDAAPIVLANPRLPADAVRPVVEYLLARGEWRGHVAIASSGTTTQVPGRNKWVVLSREALLESARAVNAWLDSGSADVWVRPLPDFHVGGLGIHARAFLSAPGSWRSPNGTRGFRERARIERATLTALVPAQVFDLTAAGQRSPAHLRAAVVGGGAIDSVLYEKARSLGWPLLPSYGLSECASQVATARGDLPDLRLLPHVTAATTEEGRLRLRSRALFSGYLFVESGRAWFEDPKEDGAFLSEDCGDVHAGCLRVYGRIGDRVKVGGENVDVARLERLLGVLAGEHGLGPGRSRVARGPGRSAWKRSRARRPVGSAGAGPSGCRSVQPARASVRAGTAGRAVREVPLSALGKVLRAELASRLGRAGGEEWFEIT